MKKWKKTFQVLELFLPKSRQKFYAVTVPWWNVFDILFITPRSGILFCLPLARDLSRYPPKRELSRKLARPRLLFPRAAAFVVGRVVQSWVKLTEG